MAEDVRRRGLPLELAVAALVAAAVLPLSRLVRGGGFGASVLSALVLSLGLAWIWRRLRLPPTLSVGLNILVLIWFVAAVFATSTLWGPFPTLDSLHRMADVIAAGNRDVIQEVAPVLLTDGILLFITAGVWVTTTLVDLAVVRARSPLLGITFAIPMFVLPGTLLDSDRRVLEMLMFLGAGALLLFLDERARTIGWGAIMGPLRPGWRASPAFRVAAVAIAGAIVIMPLLPGYGAEPALRGIGGSSDRVTFNPLVAIKPTLNKTPHRTLFTVTSDRFSYYRLSSLDVFDGDAWHERPQRELLLDRRVEPISRPGERELRQIFNIDALAGSWLPAAYEPVEIRGAGPVALTTETRTLLFPRALERGMSYEVVSRPPDASLELLDRGVTYDDNARRFLALPDRVRDDLLPIAREITRSQSTPFRRARALQNHLRGFTYDENVADGHSFSTMLEFLTVTQRGYCEQFAGTMAVLARTLGIPARVAIGFAGGTENGSGGYIVTTEHAHAWVEVFFPQAGWVAFEPTPRAGVARVPDYALPQQVEPSPIAPEPDPTQTASAPSQSPSALPSNRAPDLGGGTNQPGIVPRWSRPLIAVGILLLAILASMIGRIVLVGRRINHAPSTKEAVRTRYVDFLAWCAAAGFARTPGETPAEHARRLTAAVPEADEPLRRLADLVGYALWAPPNGLDHAEVDAAAGRARAVLAATLPRRTRALATLGWGRWRAED